MLIYCWSILLYKINYFLAWCWWIYCSTRWFLHILMVPFAGIFERFRGILHEGEIDKRVQFMIEGLFAIRKAQFQVWHHELLDEEFIITLDFSKLCFLFFVWTCCFRTSIDQCPSLMISLCHHAYYLSNLSLFYNELCTKQWVI